MRLTLTHIAHQYQGHLKRRHGSALSSEQWSALNAILGCRIRRLLGGLPILRTPGRALSFLWAPIL